MGGLAARSSLCLAPGPQAPGAPAGSCISGNTTAATSCARGGHDGAKATTSESSAARAAACTARFSSKAVSNALAPRRTSALSAARGRPLASSSSQCSGEACAVLPAGASRGLWVSERPGASAIQAPPVTQGCCMTCKRPRRRAVGAQASGWAGTCQGNPKQPSHTCSCKYWAAVRHAGGGARAPRQRCSGGAGPCRAGAGRGPGARGRWAGRGGRAPPAWRSRRTGPAPTRPAGVVVLVVLDGDEEESVKVGKVGRQADRGRAGRHTCSRHARVPTPAPAGHARRPSPPGMLAHAPLALNGSSPKMKR